MESKYVPLGQFLSTYATHSWRASFAELEQVLGFALPNSARKYQAWWANEIEGRHVQARSWLDAGFETADLDLRGERVTFRRA